MQYVVLKIGPTKLAVYGPFAHDEALAHAAKINTARTEWTASVQPLYPET